MENILLIEIVAEYLPKEAIKLYLNYLTEKLNLLFQTADLEAEVFQTYFTKCRIVVYCEGIKLKGDEKEKIIVGPPLKASYHSDGSPTDSLLGFLRKWNKELDEVIRPFLKENKEYIAIKVGSDVLIKNLLIENLPKILEQYKFQKNMKWIESSSFTFTRPVRNFVAIFNDEVLPISIFNLQATNKTYLDGRETPLKSSSLIKYKKVLIKKGIVVDNEERKKIILEKLDEIREEYSIKDEDLAIVDDWVYETQNPSLGIIEFDKNYLSLPHTFITYILKSKVYLLPLYDKNNTLTNKAIFAINELQDHDNVSFWLKEVVSARLEDLKFYWQNDMNCELAQLKEKLSYIQYPKWIGNVNDKLTKIRYVIEKVLSEFLPPDFAVNTNEIYNILKFFKCDYSTQTFMEYPHLEGEIIYELVKNRFSKELSSETLENIREAYKPKIINDQLPKTNEALLVSFADKVDEVVSYLICGLKPKFQEDPFYIRKKTALTLQILHSSPLSSIKVKEFFEKIFGYYLEYYKGKSELDFHQFFEFVLERYRNFLIEKGYKDAIVKVVMSSKWNSFKEVRNKLETIGLLLSASFWQPLFEVVNRAKRIINEECKTYTFREDLLTAPQEKELYKIHKNFVKTWQEKVQKVNNYYGEFAKEFVNTYSTPLHIFFEKVFVDVKEKDLQLNRKNLLYQIYSFFVDNFADLTLLL
jgi:glycyl-tRNA synthetase beta chain